MIRALAELGNKIFNSFLLLAQMCLCVNLCVSTHSFRENLSYLYLYVVLFRLTGLSLSISFLTK